MDFYGIAATSMALSQAKLQQAVSISVTKEVMETAETQAATLLDQMIPAPSQYQFDTYA